MSKICVGILFGGYSVEHEVSLQSAKNIINAIDKEQFEIILLGIDKQGVWHLFDENDYLLYNENSTFIKLNNSTRDITLFPGRCRYQLVQFNCPDILLPIDVIFPIIHGSLGEDGSLQGLLRMINMPYVGSSVLGSAISMDKDITKRLLRDADLIVTPFFTLTRTQYNCIDLDQIISTLGGFPLFVKPSNQGSSVGVSQVNNHSSLEEALTLAFSFDHKILIETAITGRELECAVLGHDKLQTSLCGEIILNDKIFYSYQDKYINTTDTKIIIPANISQTISDNIRAISLRAFQALNCSCMARVDFFLTSDERILINEINTLPGFTDMSMYPRLWQESGLNYTDLITFLIESALERYHNEQDLKNILMLNSNEV